MLFLLLVSFVFVNCQSQVPDSSTTDSTPSTETESGLESESSTTDSEETIDEVAVDEETMDDSASPSEEGFAEQGGEGEGEGEGEISSGIPYGFWGLNGYHDAEGFLDVQTRLGATVFVIRSSGPTWTVGTFLPVIRDAGMKVVLQMTPSPDYTTDFDKVTWKAELDDWIGSGVDAFIEDGTLIGHIVLDDIYNFAGSDPSAADLEDIAQHSKTLFPTLMTLVRERASNAPNPSSGTYGYVDAFINQFTTVDIDNGEVSDFDGDGDVDVDDYAQENAAAAESLGVGIVMGLNICDGGNGESGQTGWRAATHRTFYAMSANEILTYGTALLEVPNVLMLLNWEYDGVETWYSDGTTIGSVYFDESDKQEALYDLGQIAAEYSY